MLRLYSRVALGMAACVVVAGCNNSGVVPVSGTLTYKGKPVTNAIVNFVPETGRPSVGETDQEGRFTLTYDPQTKGAQVGKHKVYVMHNPVADANRPGVIPGEAPKISQDEREFFNKYSSDNSKVEVTIDKATDEMKLDWN